LRQVCLLAEQLYSSWLRTFTKDSIRRFSRSATLSPWNESEIRPTNWSQPILQSAHISTERSPVDPKEFRQRRVDREYLRRENETVEQRNARTLHERAYRLVVRFPVEEMRNTRISEREVIAFRRAANQVLNLFAPSKKAHNFETATERPLAVRAAKKAHIEKVVAEKKNRGVKRVLELEARRDRNSKEVAKRRKLQHEYVEEVVPILKEAWVVLMQRRRIVLVGRRRVVLMGRRKVVPPHWSCRSGAVLRNSQTSSPRITISDRERSLTDAFQHPKKALDAGTIS
jgi:hypothetical protein